MKTKKATRESTGILTYVPHVPQTSVTETFRQSVKAEQTDDGKNHLALENFIQIAEHILSRGQPTFSYTDFIYMARAHNIEQSELKLLYDQFTNALCNIGKADKVEGCYENEPIFVIQSR